MYGYLKSVLVLLVLKGVAYVASAETRSAFLIIDVQECFLPGGSLAVSRGDAIIPVINSIRKNYLFDVVVFSLDWHLPGHVSFASAHDKSPFDVIKLRYLENGNFAVLCEREPIQYFTRRIFARSKDNVMLLPAAPTIDSYSAFFDNGNFFSTSLDSELKKRNIDTVFVTGFALDICVFHTSMDAKDLGYDTYIITDATLGIDPQQVVKAKEKLTEKGVKLISHNEISAILKGTDSSNTAAPALTLLMLVLLLTSTHFAAI